MTRALVVVVAFIGALAACNVFDFDPTHIPCDVGVGAECPSGYVCGADVDEDGVHHCIVDVGEGEGEGEGTEGEGPAGEGEGAGGEGEGGEGEGGEGEGEGASGEGEGAASGEGEGEGEGPCFLSASVDGTIAIRALDQRCDAPDVLDEVTAPVPTVASFVCDGGDCTVGATTVGVADETSPDPRGDGALRVSTPIALNLVNAALTTWAVEAVVRSDVPGAPLVCSGDCAVDSASGLLLTDGAGSKMDGADLGFTSTGRAWHHVMCFASDATEIRCYAEGQAAGFVDSASFSTIDHLLIEPGAAVTAVRLWDLAGVSPALVSGDELAIATRRLFGQAGLDVLNAVAGQSLAKSRDIGAITTSITLAPGTAAAHYLDVDVANGGRAIVEVAPLWPPVHERLGQAEIVIEDFHPNEVDLDLTRWTSGTGSATTSGIPPPLARKIASGNLEPVPPSAHVTGEVATPIVNAINGDAAFSVFVQRDPSANAQWQVQNAPSLSSCSFTIKASSGGTASCGGALSGFEEYGDGWVRVSLGGLASTTSPFSLIAPAGGGDAWWPQLEPGDAATTPTVTTLGDATSISVGGVVVHGALTIDASLRQAEPVFGSYLSFPGNFSFALEKKNLEVGVNASYGAHYDDTSIDFAASFEFALGIGTTTSPPPCSGSPLLCFSFSEPHVSPEIPDGTISLDAGSQANGPRHFTRVVFSVP